jgi:hypothetical protein
VSYAAGPCFISPPELFYNPATMEYRLYCINDAGQFTNAHEIVADSDEHALQQAREMKLNQRCELWSKDRMVALLEPAKQ